VLADARREHEAIEAAQGSCQRAGVGRGEILGVEPAAQFASVEGAVVIAVELVEQLRGCTLRFGEIDRAVIIRIERF
jgi:hypothetical protein